jgi:putative selenate reductase molybdopterin-binding subunit
MACLTHRNGTRLGLPDYSAAFVKLNADGTAHLLTGAADLGTGCCTTLAQIAAEELGLNFNEINVVAADTDATPFDRGAFASATVYVTGGAVKAARSP